MRTRRRAFLGAAAGLALAPRLAFPARAAADDVPLRIATGSEVGDLDLLQNVSGFNAYTMVFEPLIRYGQNGALLPALAERWEVAPDGRSVAFDLRRGVSFSDGEPFDARAAEWNLLRWLGKDDFSWIGVSAGFDRLAVEGPNRIVLHLKAPVPAALYELTIIRPVRFLSPKAVDAAGKQSAPIGTGPWVITRNGNAETALERNEAYWGPKPSFRSVELKVVSDELARANALRAGDLDVVGGDWVAPLSPRRARTLSRESGITVYAEAGTATLIMGFNPKRPVLADARVRRAVNLAIDREAVAKTIFEGYADPTMDVFPAVIPLSGARHAVPAADAAAAGKLLDEAGWSAAGGGRRKDGTALELDLVSSEESLPGARRLSELLQAMLGQVGIAVKVSSVDNAIYHQRRPNFDYDLTFFPTYGAPYDPQGTLAAGFVSTTDSGPDGKVYLAPELDVTIGEALAATGGERQRKLQGVYDWLHGNDAVCPLVVPQRLWAHGPRVAKFVLPPTDYDMPFEGIELGA